MFIIFPKVFSKIVSYHFSHFPRFCLRPETLVGQVARLGIPKWIRDEFRRRHDGIRNWRNRSGHLKHQRYQREHRCNDERRRDVVQQRWLRITRYRRPDHVLHLQGSGHASREFLEAAENAGECQPVLRCAAIDDVREGGAW